MKGSDQIGIFLPISAVFPNVHSDIDTFRTILSELSRTDTLFWCARLNLVLSADSGTDGFEAQQFCINQFFTFAEIEAINAFVSDHGGAQKVKVFFRGQLLELLRWVALFSVDRPGDGNTYEDPSIRRKFAQAALIASDVWSACIFRNKYSLEGGIELARKRALGPNRKSVEATSEAPELTQTLGRGWALFKDYLPRHYRSFEADFSSVTGLSVEEYFVCFAAMVTSFMNPRNNSGIFNVNSLQESSRFGEVLSTYLKLESQNPDELQQALWSAGHAIEKYTDAPADYYRLLREKPILCTQDGRGIIIDPVFYSEKASIGPLFHVLKSPRRVPNEVFGAFGKGFEEYILDMLERMFPASEVLVNRFSKNIQALDSQGRSIEIDGMLNDVREIVLFEIKSVFIPEQAILDDDYKTLLQSLKAKYSISNDSAARPELKGVGQLARAAISLATKQWIGYRDEIQAAVLIYPVLIVHDVLLTSPVYGNFFASEFAHHLQPDSIVDNGVMAKGDMRVAPVIVMSVDDIENLETSLEHFAFCDLLVEYSESCPDRMMSVHNFIASDTRFPLYHNRNLAGKALQILDKCGEAVFGKKLEK